MCVKKNIRGQEEVWGGEKRSQWYPAHPLISAFAGKNHKRQRGGVVKRKKNTHRSTQLGHLQGKKKKKWRDNLGKGLQLLRMMITFKKGG